MIQRAFALLVLCFTSMAHAQPYYITDIFGQDSFPDYVFSQSIDGFASLYTIDAPDFQGFSGTDFDRPRERVVMIAKETGSARLISINPSLDETSMVVLRNGLDENATKVHVDPDTGRIYWWENDEILSVNSDGTGTPIVEADNVPEPSDLDIDSDRGFYAIISSSELMMGDLSGVSSPPPTLIPREMSGGGQIGVGINPVSGDIYWTEVNEGSGLTGSASAVYVVSHNTPLAGGQLILGSEDFFLGLVQLYRDVAAIGNQVAATSSAALFMEPKLTIFNTTTNQVTLVLEDAVTMGISINFDVDPIVQHPISKIVDLGTTGTLEVNPSDGLSTFQWFRNGTPLTDDGRISGTTTNKLIINDAMFSDTNTYTCGVMASNGDQQMSDEVIFAVRGSQAPDCIADINNDGRLNFLDISEYLSQYSSGCP